MWAPLIQNGQDDNLMILENGQVRDLYIFLAMAWDFDSTLYSQYQLFRLVTKDNHIHNSLLYQKGLLRKQLFSGDKVHMTSIPVIVESCKCF